MSTGVAHDALAQARPGTVDISITVQSDSAHVRQSYALASSSSPIELRVLTRPCAAIENMRIERGGAALVVVQSRNGPWITFRDSTASSGDSLRLIVQYDVRLAGTGIIPLVHLAAPLARTDSAPLGAVSVEVRFTDDARRVDFPHMTRAVPTLSAERAEPTEPVGAVGASSRNGTRQAPTQWSARYVGVPSFVEIGGDGVKGCGERAGERGDNGGLVWRFCLLVGIMVAWVPLYLAWARRSGESA